MFAFAVEQILEESIQRTARADMGLEKLPLLIERIQNISHDFFAHGRADGAAGKGSAQHNFGPLPPPRKKLFPGGRIPGLTLAYENGIGRRTRGRSHSYPLPGRWKPRSPLLPLFPHRVDLALYVRWGKKALAIDPRQISAAPIDIA
jgi:hypothetical protein